MSGDDRLTRTQSLKKTGAAGAAVLGGSLWATGTVAASARRGRSVSPIRNLVISCQENRSFDHYFGFAPQVQARGFGPRRGYSTLASHNHSFDASTPTGPGHATNGAPAPPRDGLDAISDLYDLFEFERAPTAGRLQ